MGCYNMLFVLSLIEESYKYNIIATQHQVMGCDTPDHCHNFAAGNYLYMPRLPQDLSNNANDKRCH